MGWLNGLGCVGSVGLGVGGCGGLVGWGGVDGSVWVGLVWVGCVGLVDVGWVSWVC